MSVRGYRRLWTYDSLVGYRYIAGLRARVEHEGGGYLMATNSAGFRCRHEFSSGPEGEPQILLFGDSFTAGTGVSDRRRYGDLLEWGLGPDAMVLNFAIAGMGLDQQLLIAERVAGDIARDLAVIGVWTDTIRRVAARYLLFVDDAGRRWVRPKPYFELGPDGALELRGVPTPRAPRPLEELDEKELRHAPVEAERHTQVAAYEVPDHPDRLLLKAVLERFIGVLRCPVVLLLLPPYRHVEGTDDPAPAHTAIAELERPPLVRVHDPLPDLQARSAAERRLLRFPTDYHPTAAYHEIVADSVLPSLTAALDSAVPVQ